MPYHSSQFLLRRFEFSVPVTNYTTPKLVITTSPYRNSQQDATMYQNLLFHVYMKLNMFRATHRPSLGAQNCTSSLWFCIRERRWTLRLLAATYKHGIINFDTLLHLVGYFCMNCTMMHRSRNIKFTSSCRQTNINHLANS